MAGLRNTGLDLSVQTVVPSAVTAAGHWTIYAQTGGIYATDDLGNVQPLSNASVDVASASAHALLLANMYTDAVVAATSATLETEFTALVAATSATVETDLTALVAATSATLETEFTALVAATSASIETGVTALVAATSATLETEFTALVAATSSELYTFTGAASANALTQANAYTDSSVAGLSAVVDGNYVHRTGGVSETIDGAKIFTDTTTFNSDVVVQGTIFAASGTFAVIAGVVSADSNIIELNVNDPGPGVTRGYAGVQIDRGTEVPYQFLFDENRDAFVVGTISGPVSGGAGEIRELQVVATREDNPVDEGIAVWKTGTPSTCGGYMFVTSGSFTYDAVTGLNTNAIVYNPSTPSDWISVPSDVFPALDELASRIVGLSGNNSNLYAVIAATSATLETEFTALVAETSAQLYAVDVATSGNLYAIIAATSAAIESDAVALVSATSAALYAVDVATSGNLMAVIDATSGALETEFTALVAATSGLLETEFTALVAATSAGLYAFTVAASANALTQAEAYTDAVSASIAQNIVAMLQGGTVAGDTSNYVYTITHNNIGSVGNAFPIVSLTVPASSSVLYVQGISDRTTTSFNVVLSDVPDAAGYAINWVLFKPYGS